MTCLMALLIAMMRVSLMKRLAQVQVILALIPIIRFQPLALVIVRHHLLVVQGLGQRMEVRFLIVLTMLGKETIYQMT